MFYTKVDIVEIALQKTVIVYKNKKIVLYGAGQFCNCVFENYDLSKLNIIAIADARFEDKDKRNF